MPLIGLVNISLGFFSLVVSGFAGVFLATQSADAFLSDSSVLQGWQHTLQASAHGHTSLFGMIQILFGLTLPYARMSRKIQIIQTLGLSGGVFAMSFLMILRAFAGPSSSYDLLGMVIGLCLSSFFLAIMSHWFGLTSRIWNRNGL